MREGRTRLTEQVSFPGVWAGTASRPRCLCSSPTAGAVAAETMTSSHPAPGQHAPNFLPYEPLSQPVLWAPVAAERGVGGRGAAVGQGPCELRLCSEPRESAGAPHPRGLGAGQGSRGHCLSPARWPCAHRAPEGGPDWDPGVPSSRETQAAGGDGPCGLGAQSIPEQLFYTIANWICDNTFFLCLPS